MNSGIADFLSPLKWLLNQSVICNRKWHHWHVLQKNKPLYDYVDGKMKMLGLLEGDGKKK